MARWTSKLPRLGPAFYGLGPAQAHVAAATCAAALGLGDNIRVTQHPSYSSGSARVLIQRRTAAPTGNHWRMIESAPPGGGGGLQNKNGGVVGFRPTTAGAMRSEDVDSRTRLAEPSFPRGRWCERVCPPLPWGPASRCSPGSASELRVTTPVLDAPGSDILTRD